MGYRSSMGGGALMPEGRESEMRVFGLGMSRAEAVAAAQAAGYTFEPFAAGSGRPHVVGRSADGGCRIELIGPQERIFKAVLMADLDDDVAASAAWFLAAFAPEWREAPAWFAARLPDVASGGDAEAHQTRLHVLLRPMGHRHAAILTLSWVPDEPAGGSPPQSAEQASPLAIWARRVARP